MIQMLRARRRSEEQGFTLIELMVVVLIIAILIAIAIPAFLGARKKAQDKEAQSNLRNALAAQKTLFSEEQSYTEDSALLEAEEPSLNYINSGPEGLGGNVVWIDAQDEVGGKYEAVLMQAYSKSRKCYTLYDSAEGGTMYSVMEDVEGPEDCGTSETDGFSDTADEGW